jgi:hypothetical protein
MPTACSSKPAVWVASRSSVTGSSSVAGISKGREASTSAVPYPFARRVRVSSPRTTTTAPGTWWSRIPAAIVPIGVVSTERQTATTVSLPSVPR